MCALYTAQLATSTTPPCSRQRSVERHISNHGPINSSYSSHVHSALPTQASGSCSGTELDRARKRRILLAPWEQGQVLTRDRRWVASHRQQLYSHHIFPPTMEHSCLRLAPLCQAWCRLVFRPSASRRRPNARIDRDQWDLVVPPRGVRDALLWGFLRM